MHPREVIPAADPKLETLRGLPLFAGLSRRSLARIARLVDEVDVPPGRVLVREGSVGRELFVLVEGEVAIERSDGHSAVIGPGEFFGEISLVTGARRAASAVATQPSRLLVISDRAFRRVLAACPALELRVLRAATRRLAGLRADGEAPARRRSERRALGPTLRPR